MPRIEVRAFTDNIEQNKEDEAERSPKKASHGCWTVTIEGGFNEQPAPIFREALRRISGLITCTGDIPGNGNDPEKATLTRPIKDQPTLY